jgi:curved DNA-binding protein CbpA
MTDAYQVLGISADSDDAAIRRRYLELVRQYPPEQHPEKFAAVREAYETLKDTDTRLHRRLFDVDKDDAIDKLIEEIACRNQRRRLSLAELLTTVRPS